MKHPLCSVQDIPASGVHKIDFFGREALVYHQGSAVKAVLSICPHLGGPLELQDDKLICPWHGAQFDARTGACLHGPADQHSKAMMLPTQQIEGVLTYVWGE